MLTTTHVVTVSDLREIVLQIGLDSFMDEIISGIKDILRLDPLKKKVPARDGFHYHKPYPGLVEWMPSRVGDGPVVIKLVGYHPQNPKHFDVPTILGTISVYDTKTGHLEGIVDGTFLTAVRTGATSAVATSVMARQDSRIVGMIGAGAQAVTQLHALSRVIDIEQVLVFDKNPMVAASLAARCHTAGFEVPITLMEIDEIVPNVDVLCTVTSLDIGEGPLFSNVPTKPSLHINAAGADFPGKTELSRAFLLDSYVCPDHREQARQQGECQQLSDDEIGEDLDVLVRHPEKYEHLRSQRTVFDSTGLALADDVAATITLRHAREMNLGSFLQIEAIPADSMNPYAILTDVQKAVR
jgi:ornithine cyclodeaminase/alanine dehydrogenase-like protein (mu-crystallin family)